MTTVYIIIIAVIILIIFNFLKDVNKDNNDINEQQLTKKFETIISLLNEAVFNGNGKIIPLNKRSFNLYEDGKNQIINFFYGTGHLTITWKYKYFHQEIAHEKIFYDVRSLTNIQQDIIAQTMLSEMSKVIETHQKNVLGNK